MALFCAAIKIDSVSLFKFFLRSYDQVINAPARLRWGTVFKVNDRFEAERPPASAWNLLNGWWWPAYLSRVRVSVRAQPSFRHPIIDLRVIDLVSGPVLWEAETNTAMTKSSREQLLSSLEVAIIIIIIIIINWGFFTLMIFYWSLSDSKYPHILRTFISIHADLNNAVVWMIFHPPL